MKDGPRENDWLTFTSDDTRMLRAWNETTSELLTKVLGKDGSVELVLPTKKEARCAWEGNFNLTGRIHFSGWIEGEADIALPYDGVFLARSFGAIHPNRLVWDNCLVEEMGTRLIRPTSIRCRNAFRFRIGLPSGNHLDIPFDKAGTIFNGKMHRFGGVMRELSLANEVFRDVYPEWIREKLFSPRLLEQDLVGDKARNELFDVICDHYKVKVYVRDEADELKKGKVGKVISPFEHLKEHEDMFDQDDLGHRVVWSFPRWLQHRLCSRFLFRRDNILSKAISLRDIAYGLVPLTGKGILDKTAGDLVYVMPENAIDLTARIYGIKRFPVSRKSAADFPAEYRQNHTSFAKRICPIESPESELVGIALQLASGAWIDKNGKICEAMPDDVAGKDGCQPFVSWGTSMIPFLHNNDGARNMMGAKNLRQAMLIEGREAPLVKTGSEARLSGIMRGLMDIGICPESRTDTKAGDEIVPQNGLSYGCNLLVAYMPWYGWNVDDAIVVSEAICEKMAVKKEKCFSRLLKSGWLVGGEGTWGKNAEGNRYLIKSVRAGDIIVELKGPEGQTQILRYADSAEAEVELEVPCETSISLPPNGQFCRRLRCVLRRTFRLGVGDKLMGRCGNKGVVAKILPEHEMPYIRLPDGRKCHAEALLNPHGVLSRMNPGQLLETHLGWLLKNGCRAGDICRGETDLGYPACGLIDHETVRKKLNENGLDRNGAVKLYWMKDKEGEIESRNHIVVGYQYFMRLDHIPELKAQARRGGAYAKYSLASCQAAQGRKMGGGQRVGEMEMWGLRAHMADAVIDEMIGRKSNATLVKAQYDPLKNQFAEKLKGSPTVPYDVLSTGFGLYLKDWLRAMLIDVRYDVAGNRLVFRRLSCDGKSPPQWDFDYKMITFDKSRLSSDVSFKCEWGCREGFPLKLFFTDVPKGSGKKTYLSVDCLLKKFGLRCQGPLKKIDLSNGKHTFRQELLMDEQSVGDLVLTQLGTKQLAFKVSITELQVSGKDCALEDFFCCVTDAKRPMSDKGHGSKKRYSCDEIIEMFCNGDKDRILSFGDCHVSCPNHPTKRLEVSNDDQEFSDGGLQSKEIFGDVTKVWENVGDKEGWGCIELPVAISGKSLAHALFRESTKKREDADFPDFDVCYIPVLPRRYRMEAITDSLSGEHNPSSLDADEYAYILDHCRQYSRSAKERDRDRCKVLIEKDVKRLFRRLREGLVDKMGLIRHEGLGRRVDRTFRLVIVPDPNLKVDECGIPADILCEILGRQKYVQEESNAKKMAMNIARSEAVGWSWLVGGHGKAETIEAVRDQLSMLLLENPDLRIILNRQPSLHRDSILAFKPEPIYPDRERNQFPFVLKLSPLCCKSFAADFDGDEMVGHATNGVSGDAQECLAAMTLRDNLLSIDCYDPTNPEKCDITYNLDRDFVTGLALLSKKHMGDLVYEKMKSKRGQSEELNKICVNNPSGAAEKIQQLLRSALEACTVDGCSFGYYDLFDGIVSTPIEGMLSTQKEKLDEQLDEMAEEQISKCGPALETIVGSDANGKSQIHQYLVARGELKPGKSGQDVKDADFVFSCTLTNGMDWDEIFRSSWNARSSMCDKKLGTALSGDFTRKLVFALQHLKIVEEKCGCSDDERSILNCQSENGICAECYGRLPNGALPPIGFPSGLIAALAIGERGTQLSMKSAHTGGGRNDFDSVRAMIFHGRFLPKGKDGMRSSNWNWSDFYNYVNRQAPDYASVGKRHFMILWRRLMELGRMYGRRSLFDKSGRFQACDSQLDSFEFSLSKQEKYLMTFLKESPEGDGFSMKLLGSQCARILFGQRGIK